MKKIEDKKLLGYFKEILLDFEMSKFPKTEQIEELKRSLKQVIKHSKINILNVGLIYSYSRHHLANVEKSKVLINDFVKTLNLDFNHYEKHRQQINAEWEYIRNWFESEYNIEEVGDIYQISDKQ